MAISVTCAKCNTTLRVKDEYAGKRGKCPTCQGALEIPGTAAVSTGPAPPAPSAKLPSTKPAPPVKPPNAARDKTAAAGQGQPAIGNAAEKVMAGFHAELPAARMSWLFRLRLLLTAIFMLIFPLLYLGLIGLLGGGAIWYLLRMRGLLEGATDAAALAAYYVPPVLGLMLAPLLLKPLLASRYKKEVVLPLKPEAAPVFFQLLEKICAVIKAPLPREVEINFSAAMARQGHRLRIGVSLLSALTVQQIAGLAAHEFAYVTRGGGTGLAAFIRGINHFFSFAVAGQDNWDLAITAATTGKSYGGKLLYPLRGAFLLVKFMLWPINYLSHMVSGWLLQTTEINSDLCQARLVGSEEFVRTLNLIKVVDFAWQQVIADLAFQRDQSQLPDNLPRQLIGNLADIPDEYRAILAEQIVKTETGDFANQPADKDRIAAARQAQLAGAYACNLPAAALLANFDEFAREITFKFYRFKFGPLVDRKSLIPVVH